MHRAVLSFLFATSLTAQVATYAVFTPLPNPLQPPVRTDARIAYDELRHRVVMGGGHAQGGGFQQDMWEWNGATWQASVPPSPIDFSKPARFVYSPAHGQVLAVTGADTNNGPPMEIRGWDGSAWTLLDASGPPSIADHYEVAWDRARNVLVMFGGVYGSNTWEWDGSVWQQVGSGGPIPRFGHRMAYDEQRQVVVLYGGISVANIHLTDTWEWNGQYWLEHYGITPPPTSNKAAMTYNPIRQRIVMHGGTVYSAETGGVFEFDGTSWSTVPTTGGPPYIEDACMAYERQAGRIVTFGGAIGGTLPRTHLVEFRTGHVATTDPHMPGCLGPAGVPTLAAVGASRPVLGSNLALQFDDLPISPFALVIAALGDSDQSWGGVPLPLDLTPLGFSGCQLHINPLVFEPLSNLGGFASWTIAIPSSPSFDGAEFFLQGLVLTPGFNPGEAVTSSSVRVLVGLL